MISLADFASQYHFYTLCRFEGPERFGEVLRVFCNSGFKTYNKIYRKERCEFLNSNISVYRNI